MATRGSIIGIILCRCGISKAMPEKGLAEVEDVLDKYQPVTLLVEDLCGSICRGFSDTSAAPLVTHLDTFLEHCDQIVVIACEPRGVKSLLAWGGLDPRLKKAELLSLRDETTPKRLQQLLSAMDTASSPGERWELPFTGEESCPSPDLPTADMRSAGAEKESPTVWDAQWVPWYPVIDREVCVDCGKCFEFCLFGVYHKEGENVVVGNPQNCKNKCPACARVCPVKAIIFPKFGTAPINGGSEEEGAGSGERGGAESLLEQRKAKRRQLFSKKFEKKLNEET